MTLPNACPKPISPPKPPKGLRKINRANVAREFKRTYLSEARRKFINLMGCAACGAWGSSQNAHVLGVDGAGLKGDYKTIAPLCTVRPLDSTGGLWPGCHHLFDTKRAEFDAHFPTFNPKKAARETHRKWLAFVRGEGAVSPEREPSNG